MATSRSPSSWASGGFSSHVVDRDIGDGATAGLFASLAIADDGTPSIAYMMVGKEDAMSDGKVSQLRFAEASSPRAALPFRLDAFHCGRDTNFLRRTLRGHGLCNR